MTVQTTSTDVAGWRDSILADLAAGKRFAALFGTDRNGAVQLTVLLARSNGFDVHDVVVAGDRYPALTCDIPAAFWYERELHDLFGIAPDGHPRLDPLVLPLGQPNGVRPRPGAPDRPVALTPDEAMLPRLVVGDGVFTIPHGPVRSGVFESIEYLVETPGEDVLHPQIRVFAKHRGVEKRFEGMTVDEGVLLAERAEGIASVAHALAFSHAIEQLAGLSVSAAAAATRVVHAELERIANHLDVAIRLADAAGLAVAVARFGWHKERVLRLISQLCGSRFGRGVVQPGGVRQFPVPPAAELRAALTEMEDAIGADERELMGTSTFLDRLRQAGPLSPELAREHGALGPIGRASGVVDDARVTRPYDGYHGLPMQNPPRLPDGDVMARLRVRWVELHDSFALARDVSDALPESAATTEPAQVTVPDGRGIGWAEAPQGEVIYVVDVVDGRIVRCKPRSASFHNLVLFHSVFAGDILTDFPFIEASFGLSPAGVVL
jgi:formate hydrogenlyase subunit 5